MCRSVRVKEWRKSHPLVFQYWKRNMRRLGLHEEDPLDLLSYRGPCSPGGVSSALQAIWSDPRSSAHRWLHFNDSALQFSLHPKLLSLVAHIDQEVIRGHYRFCNEFLWPLMHGMKRESRFRPEDFARYKELQVQVAKVLNPRVDTLFINDYHFAMIPNMVQARTSLFWHIPWPELTEPVWKPLLRDLAVGMLHAESIGFHCESYADNFLSLFEGGLCELAKAKIIIAPIGIDTEMWACRDYERPPAETVSTLGFTQDYILSVDRVDYAKGILERLNAIDLLFAEHPQYIGKLSFVQICARSRDGIEEFDKYWTDCRSKETSINSRWQRDDWRPIVWLDNPLTPDQLAVLYSGAKGLLITSLRDGLNLTAKEFAMCQSRNNGVVILSREAGVWHELKDFAITIDPTSVNDVVAGIRKATEMSEVERVKRSSGARNAIESNQLLDWYRRFEIAPAAQLEPLPRSNVVSMSSTFRGQSS
jgi:trehalose 6-phosphate synthase/phosphatase